MTHQDLKEAAMKATPGPWKWWTSNSWMRLKHDSRGLTLNVLEPYVCRDGHPDISISADDAAFIALANPARILSLIEENERMREALTPFAEFNTKIDAHPAAAKTPDDYCIHDGLKVGDFRRAFSVIKEKP